MSLLIEAIEKSSPDRKALRDVLKVMEYKDPVTGPICFDKNGNRASAVYMIQMIKGHPVILNP